MKDQNAKELKREVEAITKAVGYKGEAKKQAAQVMMLNSKAATTKKEREEQQ